MQVATWLVEKLQGFGLTAEMVLIASAVLVAVILLQAFILRLRRRAVKRATDEEMQAKAELARQEALFTQKLGDSERKFDEVLASLGSVKLLDEKLQRLEKLEVLGKVRERFAAAQLEPMLVQLRKLDDLGDLSELEGRLDKLLDVQNKLEQLRNGPDATELKARLQTLPNPEDLGWDSDSVDTLTNLQRAMEGFSVEKLAELKAKFDILDAFPAPDDLGWLDDMYGIVNEMDNQLGEWTVEELQGVKAKYDVLDGFDSPDDMAWLDEMYEKLDELENQLADRTVQDLQALKAKYDALNEFPSADDMGWVDDVLEKLPDLRKQLDGMTVADLTALKEKYDELSGMDELDDTAIDNLGKLMALSKALNGSK
jgi:hypothetical protein